MKYIKKQPNNKLITMWMEQIAEKKFKYFERYEHPLTGKQRKVSVTLNSKSNQAKKEAALLLQQKIDGKIMKLSENNMTLSELHDVWFPIYKQTVKEMTWRTAKSMWKKILAEIDGDTIVQKIEPSYIQSLLDNLYYVKNYSYSYVDSFRAQLSIILEYAKTSGVVKENIMRSVRIKKKKIESEKKYNISKKYLEPEELTIVLDELKKRGRSKNFTRYAEGMELLSITGMRYGEMAALKYEDYDGSELDINKTLFYNYGSLKDGRTDTPKNDSSYRKVALTNRGKEIVDGWIKENEFRKDVSPIYKDMGFIFTAVTGTPIHVGNLNTRLRQITAYLNEQGILDKKLSTHIFRHTHISHLASLGIPLKVIMERVGHDNPQTTLRIYTHVTKRAKNELIDVLNNEEDS